MANPLNYLAAPIAAELRKQQREVVSTSEDVRRYLAGYDIEIDLLTADRVLKYLADLKILFVVNDEYAGTYYRARSASDTEYVVGKLRTENNDFYVALIRGYDLWRRVYQNDKFWLDLRNEVSSLEELAEPGAAAEDIPASDRIVTVTHNQYQLINEPLSNIEELLVDNNGVPEDPSFRERILGNLRAGRELLRSGYAEINALRFTLLIGLKLLSEKYSDHAIGAAASALMTLILHEFGIPGF